jgi:hypothetical protein
VNLHRLLASVNLHHPPAQAYVRPPPPTPPPRVNRCRPASPLHGLSSLSPLQSPTLAAARRGSRERRPRPGRRSGGFRSGGAGPVLDPDVTRLLAVVAPAPAPGPVVADGDM